MRSDHQSPFTHRDSVIVAQHSFFACGISWTHRHSAELQSPLESGRAEKWKLESEPAAPTRLAGEGQMQPQLAESVSATKGTCPACSGSTSARRGGR